MSSLGRDSAQMPACPPDDERDLLAARLARHGLVRVPGRYECSAEAWRSAMVIAAGARRLDPWCVDLPELEVVGEFTVPPPGTVQRDFQALHIDFGLPRLGAQPVAAARFTALHHAPDQPGSDTATRVVPLARLLGQRAWPARVALMERFRCSSAGDDPVDGVLARIVEAVDQSIDLPAKNADGFLCGMEFASIEDERRYFARHGMRLEAAEEEIILDRGELVVFDNLSIAHGRRGARRERELRQLCIGFRSLDQADQAKLLKCVFGSFDRADQTGEVAAP